MAWMLSIIGRIAVGRQKPTRTSGETARPKRR